MKSVSSGVARVFKHLTLSMLRETIITENYNLKHSSISVYSDVKERFIGHGQCIQEVKHGSTTLVEEISNEVCIYCSSGYLNM